MNKKFLGFLLSLVLVLSVLIAIKSSANAQGEDPKMPPVDQIIVKYKDAANLQQAAQAQDASQMQRLNAAAGVNIDYFRPMSGDAHVMRLEGPIPVDQALAITARLEALSEVEYAEPDYIAYPLEGDLFPNDPRYYEQWHYFAPPPTTANYGVNAPAAWDITKGDSSIYIAVLDTGITDHTDLAGRWVGGYDLISDKDYANDGDGRDADPHDPGDWSTSSDTCGERDSTWHGTHVAGTIGAASNNSKGVAGLNWVSKIVPVRVLGRCGNTISDIADGIRWAAGLSISGVPDNPYPTRVINLSLGGYTSTGCAATYQNAINAAYGTGAVIVVSAGNEGIDAKYYHPANCANVITVAATNRYGNKTSYSNWGELIEISAPGGDSAGGVLSTSNIGTTVPVGDDYYRFMGGTSMAAPHVSGVVSLMFSLNPTLTPSQVLSILQSTATTISCTQCGSGIVNAAAALQAVPDAAPGVPVLSNIDNLDGDNTYVVNWIDVPNADSYRLQEDDNISFSSPKTVSNILISQYPVSGAAPGTWYYRVQSINDDGASAWSNTVYTTVKPESPVLEAINNPTNEDSYLISWSSQPGADGYILLEADNDFSGATIKYQGTDTSYQVTGQAGGTWYYKVRAYNGVVVGDLVYGDLSNLVITSVSPSPLPPPLLDPIVNTDQDGDFTVSWTAVPTTTEISYILEESDNPYFADPMVVYDGLLTEKQIEKRAGGSWSYRVRAISDADQSPWSNSESAFVLYELYLPLILKQYSSTSDCTPDPSGDSDNIGDALIVCSDQAVTGQVNYDDDWDDVFQIYAIKGQTLTAALNGSGGDADLYLYNPSATDIYGDPYEAYSTNYGNDEFIQGTVLVGGYWYIDVYSAEGTTNYNLVVTLSSTTTSQTAGFSKSTDGRQPR